MDKRKPVAILLLSITILPLLLFLFFVAHQNYIRWQMEEKLEHEQLTSITLNESEFRWHKKDKEIIFNGHFFDVKTIKKIAGNKLLITGLYDYQEQQLHNTISKLLNKKSGTGKLQKLAQQMFAFVGAEPVHPFLHQRIFEVNTLHTSFYNERLSVCFVPIIIPPPKFVSVLF